MHSADHLVAVLLLLLQTPFATDSQTSQGSTEDAAAHDAVSDSAADSDDKSAAAGLTIQNEPLASWVIPATIAVGCLLLISLVLSCIALYKQVKRREREKARRARYKSHDGDHTSSHVSSAQSPLHGPGIVPPTSEKPKKAAEMSRKQSMPVGKSKSAPPQNSLQNSLGTSNKHPPPAEKSQAMLSHSAEGYHTTQPLSPPSVPPPSSPPQKTPQPNPQPQSSLKSPSPPRPSSPPPQISPLPQSSPPPQISTPTSLPPPTPPKPQSPSPAQQSNAASHSRRESSDSTQTPKPTEKHDRRMSSYKNRDRRRSSDKKDRRNSNESKDGRDSNETKDRRDSLWNKDKERRESSGNRDRRRSSGNSYYHYEDDDHDGYTHAYAAHGNRRRSSPRRLSKP